MLSDVGHLRRRIKAVESLCCIDAALNLCCHHWQRDTPRRTRSVKAGGTLSGIVIAIIVISRNRGQELELTLPAVQQDPCGL